MGWAEGYYVSTVGLNEATIREYIQEQENHDTMADKLSVKASVFRHWPVTEAYSLRANYPFYG